MSVVRTMTVFDGACPVCAMNDSVVECNGCKQNWCESCGSGGDCTCIQCGQCGDWHRCQA